jgi:hypothetical protein
LGYLLFLQKKFNESLECALICESIINTQEKVFKFNFDLAPEHYVQSFKKKIQIRKIEIFESKKEFDKAMEVIKEILRKNYK